MSNTEDKNKSFASVFDVSNVLSKDNFKPYWETIRDYFFLVMISIAVYMAFSAKPGDHFHCRPSANLQNNLTADDSAYVNAVCFGQFAKFQPIGAYAGPLSVVSSLLVFVTIMLWLSAPTVIDVFTTVYDVDEAVRKSSIEVEALDQLIAEAMLQSPAEGEDVRSEVLVVKEMANELWSLRRQSDALVLYIVRNLISLLLIGISVSIPIIVWTHQDTTFECKIQISGYDTMTCVHMIADQIQPSLIVFCLSIAMQAFLLVYSLLHLAVPASIRDDGQLVLHFSKYSRAVMPVTRYILTRALSDVSKETEAAEEDGETTTPDITTTTSMRPARRLIPVDVPETAPFIPRREETEPPASEEDIQQLKLLRPNTLDALGANDFSSCVSDHERFFTQSTVQIIKRGCGCDDFNFNLRDVDKSGTNLLYRALKKGWWSQPNFKVIYHFLTFSTDKYVLSREKLVNDGDTLMTVERFLLDQSDSATMKSLVEAVKQCKDAGDFAKYVQMTEEGDFRFIKS